MRLGYVVGVILLCVTAAWGQDRFKETYDSGVALYGQEHFAGALSAFQEAYRYRPDPMLLLVMAKVQLKLGQGREAQLLCEKYLQAVPRPPSATRQKVTEYLAHARQLKEAPAVPAASGVGAANSSEARSVAAPAQPAAPEQTVMLARPEQKAPPNPEASPAPFGPQPGAVPRVSPILATPGSGTARENSERRSRWWIWSLVGVAAAGAVTGAVLGVLYRPQEPTRFPNNSDLNF